MSYDTATPYLAAYIIFRKNDKIAFLLRSNTPWMNGYYSLPAGKVEEDEAATATAIREAEEEVGVKIHKQDLKPILTVHRRSGDSDWLDVIFEADKWQGELRNAEPDTHGELAWFNPNNLPENTIDYISFYIKQIAAGKQYAEYGWD